MAGFDKQYHVGVRVLGRTIARKKERERGALAPREGNFCMVGLGVLASSGACESHTVEEAQSGAFDEGKCSNGEPYVPQKTSAREEASTQQILVARLQWVESIKLVKRLGSKI